MTKTKKTKKTKKTEDPSPGLAAKSEKTLGKTRFFSESVKISVLGEVYSVFHCISGPFAHVKLQLYPFNDRQELVCYL